MSERDQAAEALQVAEQRYAEALRLHGQLLEEQALLAAQLGRFLSDQDPLPFAMRPLLERHTRLRGHNAEVGLVQQAGAAVDRLAVLVASGRAILARLDVEQAELAELAQLEAVGG